MAAPNDSFRWFSEARFGIFIHWGLYSVHGRDVWAMYNEQIPVDEYRLLADEFVPTRYDPNEWAAIVKDAGARYMVMCSRQHDGYSLFDSAVSDFTSVKCAAKRDLIGEYAEALHRAGLKVGFYYSLLDWRYPAYFKGPERDPGGWAEFRDYVHAQVRELCTKYGKVDIMWYDGAWPYDKEAWRSDELNTLVRELQPGIIINDRSAHKRSPYIGATVYRSTEPREAPADFSTPEQTIPYPGSVDSGRRWESCMTMNDHWGYNPADHHWKTTTQLVHNLVQCASANGNYLLNVGPDPEGEFPPEAVTRLREFGRWLAANGGSVYGTEHAGVVRIGMVHTFPTVKDKTLYTHVFKWPGTQLTLGNIASKVRAVHFVDGGQPISFRQDGSRVFLTRLPQYSPDDHDTVIALECEGRPESIDRFA